MIYFLCFNFKEGKKDSAAKTIRSSIVAMCNIGSKKISYLYSIKLLTDVVLNSVYQMKYF